MQEDLNNGTFDLFVEDNTTEPVVTEPIEPNAPNVEPSVPAQPNQPATPSEPVDDFWDLGEWPEGHPRYEAPTDEPKPAEPATPQEPLEPKNDPTRFEYWQSRANRVESQIKEAEPYLQLAAYLQQNPQALNSLKSQLSASPVQGQQPTELVKPERPVKPADYDSVEAHNNPESSSYKWREAMDNYRESIADYYEQKEETRQQAADLAEAQRQQVIAQRTQMNSLANDLVMNQGFKPADARQFVTEYSDPRSITLDNLIKLWRVTHSAPSAPIESNQVKKEALINRRGNMQIPLPAAAQPNVTNPADQFTDEDLFNASLRAAGRARRR
jgi:hypothetical protein